MAGKATVLADHVGHNDFSPSCAIEQVHNEGMASLSATLVIRSQDSGSGRKSAEEEMVSLDQTPADKNSESAGASPSCTSFIGNSTKSSKAQVAETTTSKMGGSLSEYPQSIHQSSSQGSLSESLDTDHFAKSHKLSTLTTATFILACVTLPVSIAFLGFLWSYPEGTKAPQSWLDLVLNGWTLRSITITTMALSTAISVLSAVSTSMIASIIMERRGVLLHRMAAVSALRYINNGPQSLTLALIDMYSQAGAWGIITLMLYATTALLQFTSTLLVQDLDIGPLIGPVYSPSVFGGLSWESANILEALRESQTSYWTQYMQIFPTFAEYHEEATSIETNPPDGISDTGLTLRAFVPFLNETDRTSIQQFSGVGTIEDSRVVCIRPQMHADFSFGYLSDSWGWLLNGSMTPEVAPPGLILQNEPAMISGLEPYNLGGSNSSNPNVTLSWGQQVPFAHDEGWGIAQNFMYFGPALVSSLDPRYPSIISKETTQFTMTNPDYLAWNLSYYVEGDDIPLMTGRSYELLNITVAQDISNSILLNSTEPSDAVNFFFSPDQDQNKLVITPENHWLVFTIPRIPGWRVAVSLCYDSVASIDADIQLAGTEPKIEPLLGAWNASSGLIDTTQVRNQLGVLPGQDPGNVSRSIWDLETTPEQLRAQVQGWYNESKSQGWSNISFPTQNLLVPYNKYYYSWGNWMCVACAMEFVNSSSPWMNITYTTNNELQEQIFQDVMRSTANTPMAWQAYYTNLARLVYYEKLPYFDAVDVPQVSSYKNVQFPKSRRGFLTVVSVLSVHLVLVAYITVTFFITTRLSRIGDNAWLGLAQMLSQDLEGVLQASATLKDGDVKTELDRRGLGNEIVYVRR